MQNKFAVIKTGGLQYIVQEGDRLLINKIIKPKKTIEFNDVLLISDDDKEIKIGSPKITNAKVSAEILRPEVKGKKVITVKYKPKKRYKRKVGFRPRYTEIKITKITS